MKHCLRLLVALAATHAVAQTPANVRPLSAPDDRSWTIRWDRSDDFNGDAVDWRKWVKQPETFRTWAWDNDANVVVSGGVATLTARRIDEPQSVGPNQPPTPYTSAMLKSYAAGTYGYYEARLKASPVFPGVCPSFWMYSTIDDRILPAGEVRYSEIDVVELTQRGDRVAGNERIADHNLHAILSNGRPGIPGRDWRRPNDKRYSDAQATEYRLPFDPAADFHTYGCEVSPEEIVWFVDGAEVGRKPNELWHRRMNVALSLGLRPPFTKFADNRMTPVADAPADRLPASMQVDYVRVWERLD